MGYTPFFIIYGAMVVIPSDLDYDAPRIHFYDKQQAEEQRQADVEMLEEVWNTTDMRSARYQRGLHRYHARGVRERSFVVGDLILRRVTSSKKGHKLTWP